MSTYWRDTIAGSQKLQKLLFFLPVGGAERTEPEVSFDNPMLAPIFTRLPAITSDILFAEHSVHEKYTRPEASWRLMLINQPPTEPSMYPVDAQRDCGQGGFIRWPAIHEGPRMYDILFSCENLLRVGQSIVAYPPGDMASLLQSYGQLEEVKWSSTSALEDEDDEY